MLRTKTENPQNIFTKRWYHTFIEILSGQQPPNIPLSSLSLYRCSTAFLRDDPELIKQNIPLSSLSLYRCFTAFLREDPELTKQRCRFPHHPREICFTESILSRSSTPPAFFNYPCISVYSMLSELILKLIKHLSLSSSSLYRCFNSILSEMIQRCSLS